MPWRREFALPDVRNKFVWLFCLLNVSERGLLVGVFDLLSSMFLKLFDARESWSGGHCSLSWYYWAWDEDYCLLKPKGVKDLCGCLLGYPILRLSASIGLRLPVQFWNPFSLVLNPKIRLPSSFYLFAIIGDLLGIPILWTFTGVEFNCEPGLTILVRTGVDALEILMSGLIKLGLSCVGGWMFDE